eukprot:Tamp_27180.p1 GENE.Tamp_27180~~Tamp_27180.p1  ORF type:complete len:268 (-),score=19.14 Tamp_27180:60-812(-)
MQSASERHRRSRSRRREPKRRGSRRDGIAGMDLSQQAFAMEWDAAHDSAGAAATTVWDAPVESPTRELSSPPQPGFLGAASASPRRALRTNAAANEPAGMAAHSESLAWRPRGRPQSAMVDERCAKPLAQPFGATSGGLLQSAAAFIASWRSGGSTGGAGGAGEAGMAGRAGRAGRPQTAVGSGPQTAVGSAQRLRTTVWGRRVADDVAAGRVLGQGARALHGGFASTAEGRREGTERARSASRSVPISF